MQVLSEMGQSKAVAFDQIDKVGFRQFCIELTMRHALFMFLCLTSLALQAPEEKARGITIATAHGETASDALITRHTPIRDNMCPFGF